MIAFLTVVAVFTVLFIIAGYLRINEINKEKASKT